MATRRVAVTVVQPTRPQRAAQPANQQRAAPKTASQPRVWLDRAWFVPAALTVVALALYLVRLGDPPGYSFDEVYHAYTAAQYVDGNTDAYVWWTTVPEDGKPNPSAGYEWTHPPLGKWLIASGIVLLGDEPAGWRLASAVFGAVGVALAFFLGLRLTGSRLVGGLAAGLLLADGLYFIQSRTGMVDIFVTVFSLGAFLTCYAALTAPPGEAKRPLMLTGILLGLALATKWNAAYAAFLIGLMLAGNALRLLWLIGRERERRAEQSLSRRPGAAPSSAARPTATWTALREYLIWLPLALGALPLVIYLLAYGPFFFVGYSWDQFIELQRQMWHYHSNLQATHAYQSDWWQWPLAAKPVWYHVTWGETTRAFTYANLNPILAWAMIPAVLAVGWLWWRQRRLLPLLILFLGFFGQWLPWALSPRISFAYHFLPAVPFGALAVGIIAATFWRQGGIPRYAAAGYVVAVLAAFIFFYPIWAGVPLSPDRLELRYWFDAWR